MSRTLGKNLEPCMRENGEIMMRMNVDPVVLCLDDIVWDLAIEFESYGHELKEIKRMTKKELKKNLKYLAQYRSYNYDGRESPSWYWDDKATAHFELIKFEVELLVLKWFPKFKGEQE